MSMDKSSGHGAGKGAAGIGILALILRLCSDAGDIARPLRYADDVAEVARYGDEIVDVGRGLEYVDEASDARRILSSSDELLDEVHPPPGYQFADEAEDSRYAANPHSSDPFQIEPHLLGPVDDLYEVQRNLQFMENYVTNFHTADDWLPFQTGETIKRSIITQTVYDVPANNPQVISIIPTEETSFQKVFGSPLSVSAKREMEKNLTLFRSLDNSYILSSDDLGEAALFKLIRQNGDTNPLIIVGHSDEINAERFIVLPNGEKASIAGIHKVCLEAKARCLVLTCYSDDFRLTGKISLEEAYYMTRRGLEVMDLVQNHRAILPQSVISALDQGSLTEAELMVAAMRSERIVRKTAKLTMVGVVSSTSAGGTYLVVSHYGPE